METKRPFLLVAAILAVLLLVPALGACSENTADTGGPAITPTGDVVAVGGSGGSCSYMELTPEQAKQLIDTNPDVMVVDLSSRYSQGHIPAAVNYGLVEFQEAIPTLDKDVPYLLYCHGCSPISEENRSYLEAACPSQSKSAISLAVALGESYRGVGEMSPCACAEMARSGFTAVYRLAGNYAAWVDAGYPVAPRANAGHPRED